MSESKFTRAELFELLTTNYGEEQIIAGLQQLAQSDPTIDPNAEEFPVDVSDRLEKIFNLAQAAIDQSKLLLGSSANLDHIKTKAIEVVAQQLQVEGISQKVFQGILEIAAGKVIAEAVVIDEFKENFFLQVAQELEMNRLGRMSEAGYEELAFMWQLAKNPTLRQKLLQEHGLKGADQLAQELDTTNQNLTPGFDAIEFLQELGLPNQEKKSIQPTTLKDWRTITKSLVQNRLNPKSA